MPDRIRYRKLPGRRRGFLRGSSVWLGPDHLLLVKSYRFREEYKRYHFKDIQAIAIAHQPRFHFSTRAAGILILWFIAFAVLRLLPWGQLVLWTSAAALAAVWLYVSAYRSCICRIYTAVSADELPSVYRTWTAARFLRAVEPPITEVQGEFAPGWTEAIESHGVGPRAELPPSAAESAAAFPSTDSPAPAAASRAGQFVLLAALSLDAIARGVVLYFSISIRPLYLNFLSVLVIAAAIFALVQYQQHKASRLPRLWAIVTLISLGAIGYVRIVAINSAAAIRASATRQSVELDYSGGALGSEIEMGTTLLLSLIGLGLLAGRDSADSARTIVSGT